MRRITILLFFFIFLLSGGKAEAQSMNKKYKYTSVGFNFNAMNYVGDLDPSPGIFGPGIKNTHPDIGICILQRISPRVSIRGNLSYGRIQASDKKNSSYANNDIYRKARNLSFRNNILELKADVIWDLYSFWGKFIKRPDYVPYLFTGVAFFHHNPQALAPSEFGGKWVDLQPLQLEGKSYSLNQIAIPAGIGLRYKISSNLDFAFEIGARLTFTDYLDDVSGTYAGRESFGDDPFKTAMQDRSMEGLNQDPHLTDWVENGNGYNNSNGYITINGYGRAGDQRGNKKRNDWYMVTGFHITYILQPGIKCPLPPKFL